jgi:uncharacterized protein (AIM24 family)
MPAFDSNIHVVESYRGARSYVEIQEYTHLRANVGSPQLLYHYNSLGLRLKRVRVVLDNGEMRAEAGALHYMRGHLQLSADVGGASGYLKKAISGALTHEATVKPKYTGTGDIYLEPSFGYYAIVVLANEECIVDKGLYYASDGPVEVGVAAQKSVSSALFGGEGLFQTRISGTGWAVIQLPVPSDEVQRIYLNNEKLSVDGSFAVLRKGAIAFTVEKSSKSLIGSGLTGEGLLQTFTGTGEVWVCPTLNHYPHFPAGAQPPH